MFRDNTRKVRIGSRIIGGGEPVLIQSMTNTPTEDIDATVRQINTLAGAGCDIIRSAVPTMQAAEALKEIKKQITIPLVADIHFDYKLALTAIDAGADKIRINPGNIGSPERVKKVVDSAKEHQIPIRVGVNSGSLEKDLLKKYGRVCPEALAESALNSVRLLEDMDFDDIVVSIKASDVMMCVEANKAFAKLSDRPLHVGITESGTLTTGNIKSAVGLALILNAGIGDTVRVSLTGDPVNEVYSALEILKALKMRTGNIDIVSCPTCGRTKIDLISLAENVQKLASSYDLPGLKLAVMGCVVNGPGEAKEADLGIAGGAGEGLIFKKGEIVRKVPEDKLLEALKYELDNWRE